MRHVLIDPVAETVTEIELDGTDAAIRRALDAVLSEALLSRGEWLYTAWPTTCDRYFLLAGLPLPVKGRAVISGAAKTGGPCALRASVAEVRDRVTFTPPGYIPPPFVGVSTCRRT